MTGRNWNSLTSRSTPSDSALRKNKMHSGGDGDGDDGDDGDGDGDDNDDGDGDDTLGFSLKEKQNAFR